MLVFDLLCFASLGLHAGLRHVTQPVALPFCTRRYPTTVATLSRRARDIIEQSFEHTRWVRELRPLVWCMHRHLLHLATVKPLAECFPCHGPACSAREASPAHSWTAAFMTLASGEGAPCSSPQCPVSYADKSPCPDSSKLACAHSQLMYLLERGARTTHGDCSCC